MQYARAYAIRPYFLHFTLHFIRPLAGRIVSCLVDKADPDFHQDDDFL